MTAALCPLCRLPQRQAGRMLQAVDVTGLRFVFSICLPCRIRVDRLPATLRKKQIEIAMRNLADRPDDYGVKTFPSAIEARLYCRLAAERGGG